MTDHSPNVTPFLKQYLEAKRQVPEAVLFFRMGDFYELFFEDAVKISAVLEIALTSRDKKADNPIPMCGVPVHAVNGYLARLVEQGFKVAICEQMEDPAKAKGIVRREITRVITPGVILDPENLVSEKYNYLAAVVFGLDGIALACLDASCGDFRGTVLEDGGQLRAELLRLEPAEVLCQDGVDVELKKHLGVLPTAVLTLPGEDCFLAESREEEDALLGLESGRNLPPLLARAARALLRYVKGTQRGRIPSLGVFNHYRVRDHLALDETAVTDLEIHRTIVGGKRKGSLLWVLDRTATPMGKRLLKTWVAWPLMKLEEIRRRQDAVAELLARSFQRRSMLELLGRVGDLERTMARVESGGASGRDLRAVAQALEAVTPLRDTLAVMDSELLRSLAGLMDPHEELHRGVLEALVDEPPATIREGGMFREEHQPRLADLAGLARGGREWMSAYEAKLKADSGISSLKVRFNKVFGYYIEVTNSNLHLVPATFIRKQTTAGAERFYTPELKDYEEKVLHAEELQFELELELFKALQERVLQRRRTIALCAGAVAVLDVLLSLATVAETNDYHRPEVDHSGVLEIVQGRHPVIEQILPRGRFVPNDLRLELDTCQFMILTGPNMAGKSTIMRQAALIVLLAQMGSFVPAASARIGVVDRIFTRVGATDSLSTGASTFMMEMRETSEILKKATRRSLVILDEIGRGTSTFDGLAIAWAASEYLHDVLGARTLFATHYHELTELAREKPRMKNYCVAVKEFGDDIYFLHQLVEGATSRSYGVQVARLAGLPTPVIERAKELLRSLEDGGSAGGIQGLRPRKKKPGAQGRGLFEGPGAPEAPDETQPGDQPSELEQRLLALQPDTLTPLLALEELYKLRALAIGTKAK
jgi:DNA mismatch repair protein MutS